jgi:hypothetical protein
MQDTRAYSRNSTGFLQTKKLLEELNYVVLSFMRRAIFFVKVRSLSQFWIETADKRDWSSLQIYPLFGFDRRNERKNEVCDQAAWKRGGGTKIPAPTAIGNLA